MTEIEIRKRMDEAFREDRARFFKVTDGMKNQPKYADKIDDIERVCQEWRDKPATEDYPNFTHPMPIPDYFPKVPFFSNWEKDIYISEELKKWENHI